tara:strand:- start:262498 stop:263190 length:693 start_codon:yes stop_codon:yes gene_type:complete
MRNSKTQVHEAMALVETNNIEAIFDTKTSTLSVKSPYSHDLVNALVESGLGYYDEKGQSWVFALEQMESVVQTYNEHYPDLDMPSALLKGALTEADATEVDAESQVAIAEIEGMGDKAASVFALAESYALAVGRIVPTLDLNLVAAVARDFGIYPIGWEDDVTKLNSLLSVERYTKDMAQEDKNKVLALQRFLNALEEGKFRGVYSRDVLNHLVKPAGLAVTKNLYNPNY